MASTVALPLRGLRLAARAPILANPLNVVALALIAMFAACALFAPLLAPYDPLLQELGTRRHAGHVDVAAHGTVTAGGVLGPALHDPAQVELGIADRAHLPVHDCRQLRWRAVFVHDVGELVVAVHHARDEVDRLVAP